MKAFLVTLLIVISLGICAVCAFQWKREAALNEQIRMLTATLIAENKLRLEFEEKAARFELEITRLTNLRAEAEAALVSAQIQVKDLAVDQSARGYSIAVLMNELIASNTELNAFKQLAGKGTDAVKLRNVEVSAQNAAIEKQNAQLKQLANERDNAINQLNTRTREFNELTEKYNKLARSVEASRQ